MQVSAAAVSAAPVLPVEVILIARKCRIMHSTNLVGVYMLTQNISSEEEFEGVYQCTHEHAGQYQMLAAKVGNYEVGSHEHRMIQKLQNAAATAGITTGFIKCHGGCTVRSLEYADARDEVCTITEHLYIIFYEWLYPKTCPILKNIPKQRDTNFFTPSVIQRIAKQLFKNIEFAHEHGIILNDIKPENLAYNLQTKMLIIFDFNTSFRIGRPLRILPPTCSYRAPEMMLGRSHYLVMGTKRIQGTNVDLWSAYTTIAELYMGISPFNCIIQQSNPKIYEDELSSDPESDDEELKYFKPKPEYPTVELKKVAEKRRNRTCLKDLAVENRDMLLSILRVIGFPQMNTEEYTSLETLCALDAPFLSEMSRIRQSQPCGLGPDQGYRGVEGVLEMQLRDFLTRGLTWHNRLTFPDLWNHPFLKDPAEAKGAAAAAAAMD